MGAEDGSWQQGLEMVLADVPSDETSAPAHIALTLVTFISTRGDLDFSFGYISWLVSPHQNVTPHGGLVGFCPLTLAWAWISVGIWGMN